jgi:NAD(P)-dependent dehydrogenase (short-subunit alcohol dehydrogenase family)
MKRAQWQEVVDVNLTGVYLCAQVSEIFLLASVTGTRYAHVSLITFQAAAAVMMKRKKVQRDLYVPYL